MKRHFTLHTGKNRETMSTETVTATKKSVVDAANKAQILAKASKVDVENIRTNLAKAKGQVTKQLIEVEEELVTRAEELKAVEESITIRTDQLTELHGKDEVLLSLDELRIKKETLEASVEARRKQIEAEDLQLRSDAAKARSREEADHVYTRDLNRKKDNDAWAESKAAREKELSTREAIIDTRQADQDKALARFEKIDEEITLAANVKAKAQIDAISTNHRHEKELTKKDSDAMIGGLQKDITHRDATITTLQSELASTKAQLVSSLTAQTELAKSTVDNAKAKEAYQEAMTTASSMSGGSGNGRPARS